MRKREKAKRAVLWLLAGTLTAGNFVSAAGGQGPEPVGESRQERTDEERTKKAEQSETERERRRASGSLAEREEPGDEDEREASGHEREDEDDKKEKIASPSGPFKDREDWEEATAANAVPLSVSATGDLWDHWLGADMDWEGDGSEQNPYEISGLSGLMGLSEAVAQGESFSGRYFELKSDIDLGDLELEGGSWNPIGWYQNRADLGGEPETAFEGCFDGAGHTISGLKFAKADYDYSYLGLFGLVDGAEIRNLSLEAQQVSGADNVGILVGRAEGDSRIFNVTVSGAVYAQADAGGIAGEVDGGSGRTVIENCRAEDVVVNSQGRTGFVGGIAGNVQKGDLVDVKAVTMDGDSSRIQGKGYVGGIAGRQNQANIYNSYVCGTIGGNQTRAVGGICGLYQSGDIVVARFDGEIGRTNQGMASQEGTFVGTREPENGFRYGTGKEDHFSYLYAGAEEQVREAVGSGIADDNVWTFDAHIGYFTDYGKKYVKVAGERTEDCGERYFYEELEDGIQYVITQKTEQEVDIDYGEGQAFKIDHYAPGSQGQPVRGYLVSVPRIDTKNANGTYDSDVATLTAIPEGTNSYYRPIDKENPAAVAPGSTLSVTTAAKNKGESRYQMAYDAKEPGKVKPPTYTDEAGDRQPMTYVNGGSYTFEMPECDTELNAEYVKVTTMLAMEPEETEISVVQTRTGDRKEPEITTEVRDGQGRLIARYIDGALDQSAEVLPVRIQAKHNGAGDTADRTVLWSIDNTDLLRFEDGFEGGYTQEDARVLPDLDSDFIQGHIQKAQKDQADGGYEQPIANTVYRQSAVVTASTNPATSVDQKAVTGTCKVTVSFQIKDQTTLRVEGMSLNKSQADFWIIRRLTGDRTAPEETYVSAGEIRLSASLNPARPFYKNVTWADTEDGKIIKMAPEGVNQQECRITAVYDPEGKNHPAWIQNIVSADNAAKELDGGYLKLDGSGIMTETVTATSEDQTHGVVKAQCQVTVHFVTDDQTVIHPEGLQLDREELSYDLEYQFQGDTGSEITEKRGFGERDTLKAVIFPQLSEQEGHEPYNRTILWESSDPEAVAADGGRLTVLDGAPWIKEAMEQAPYQAKKQVVITARTEDGDKTASCLVDLSFSARALEADREKAEFEIVLTRSGRRSSPSYTWSGGEGVQLGAVLYPENEPVKQGWKSADEGIVTVTEQGFAVPVILDGEGNVKAQWLKDAITSSKDSVKTQTELFVESPDGTRTDRVIAGLTLKVVDNTYSSSGGGGGGGGGGSSSGASSSGTTPTGSIHKTVTPPAGAVTGEWVQAAAGQWLFKGNGRTYAGEWAFIHNPYAGSGQNSAEWFYFGADGFMETGWYTDPAGNIFYLNPVSDNTLGRMFTGWNWIDDDGDGVAQCYYFNTQSDGTKGRLFRNETTPDGFQVNEKGQWIVEGVIQTKENRKG